MRLISSRLGLLFLAVSFGAILLNQTRAADTTLAPVKLRGYGELSGTWKAVAIDGKPGSLLRIDCESEDKAKLVMAKYVSDLQVLPGVKAVTIQGQEGAIPAFSFDQGAFLAARAGKQVFILTAPSADGLAGMEKSSLTHGHLVFTSETDVPMWLDRWDKYGFRFYYQPTFVPDGKTLTTYDKAQELDWSVKNQTGLQVWDPLYEHDNAAGTTDRNIFQWVADESQKRKLPLGINFGTTNQLWLEDWFPEEMAQHMPQFVGSFYNGALAGEDGLRFVSWNSTIAADMQMATLEPDVKRFNSYTNLTSWLEPHGEMGHGDTDFLLEYGPVADKTFRQWLQNKYKTIDVVSQRWKGAPDALKSWDDVHVPEVASFSGWGPDALDLTGPWKVFFADTPQVTLPILAFTANYDDSAWPEMIAPGDDISEFVTKYKPAIFRRHFQVDKAWLQAHPKVWLYVFDLNRARDQNVTAALNGQQVGESKILDPTCHRDWYEVTSALHEGANTLTIGLPSGYLGYRVYLSGSEPRTYPDLGPQQNALWADFADWAAWSRVQQVQRGMEMIRRTDPNRNIMLMSPGPFFAGEQTLAKKYGGDMHDTGGMGGWWNDFLPQLMAGVGLPCSCEPGGPPSNVKDLHRAFSLWSTEGIQGMDYFLQLGDIYWNAPVKADFEENLKLWKLFGKYHVPNPGYAIFYSGRNANLLSFPWNRNDQNLVLYPGWPRWGWSSPDHPRPVAVTEEEFFNGGVNQYPVIIDSNSEILDQDMIDAITAYVKQGGIFVTYVQTGRHSSTLPNSWPIQQLTGYSTTRILPYQPGHDLMDGDTISLAPGQTFFDPAKWSVKNSESSSGHSLKKIAPECQDLLLWKDGSVAAGMRPLGKGYVFDLGVKWDSILWGETRGIDQVFNAVLAFAKLAPEPARMENVSFDAGDGDTPNPNGLMFRHFLSNNGLYDVWSLSNMTPRGLSADLVFHDIAPAGAIKVKSGDAYPVDKSGDGHPELKIHLDSLESESYLTPRAHLEMASKEWFDLQRQWWMGTTPPPQKTLPSMEAIHKYTLPLSDDWVRKDLTVQDDSAALAAPGFDDSKWEKQDFQATLVPPLPDKAPPRRAIFRKKITVPASWNNGSITFWMTPSEGGAVINKGIVYYDGAKVGEGENVVCLPLGNTLKAGTTHILAIEVQSTACLFGNIGSVWLYYRPNPASRIDLKGTWQSSDDALVFDSRIDLPGPWYAHAARAVFNVPADKAGQTALMHLEVDGRISGVIVNGTLVSRTHVQNTLQFDLNLTPWLHFGQDNKFVLVCPGKQQATIKSMSLDFYPAGSYP